MMTEVEKLKRRIERLRHQLSDVKTENAGLKWYNNHLIEQRNALIEGNLDIGTCSQCGKRCLQKDLDFSLYRHCLSCDVKAFEALI